MLLVPGIVLDRWWQPDALVVLLQLTLAGQLLPLAHARVPRLGRAGEVVDVQVRGGDHARDRAPATRAGRDGRILHALQDLIDDPAGWAFVLVDRHRVLRLAARETSRVGSACDRRRPADSRHPTATAPVQTATTLGRPSSGACAVVLRFQMRAAF